MTEKKFGCHVDLAKGEEPDDCVVNFGAHGDCIYAIFPSGRRRRTPRTCKWWKEVK